MLKGSWRGKIVLTLLSSERPKKIQSPLGDWIFYVFWSGRSDSNTRPLAPHAGHCAFIVLFLNKFLRRLLQSAPYAVRRYLTDPPKSPTPHLRTAALAPPISTECVKTEPGLLPFLSRRFRTARRFVAADDNHEQAGGRIDLSPIKGTPAPSPTDAHAGHPRSASRQSGAANMSWV